MFCLTCVMFCVSDLKRLQVSDVLCDVLCDCCLV